MLELGDLAAGLEDVSWFEDGSGFRARCEVPTHSDPASKLTVRRLPDGAVVPSCLPCQLRVGRAAVYASLGLDEQGEPLPEIEDDRQAVEPPPPPQRAALRLPPPAGYVNGRVERAAPAAAILTRMPPQNLEAEESVLGAILIAGQPGGAFTQKWAIETAGQYLTPRSFYREAHRVIYAAMLRLDNDGAPIDLTTLAAQLASSRNDLETAGGREALARFVDIVPTAANIEHHARIVRDHAIARDVAARSAEIASRALEYKGGDVRELMVNVDRALTHWTEMLPVRSEDDDGQAVAVYETPQALYRVVDEIERQPWVWDRLLPHNSISLLVGKSETGKSTLIYTLIYAILSGAKFLGRQCERGRVIYLAGDPASEVVAGQLFRDLGVTEGLTVISGALVAMPNGLKLLREQVRKVLPALVVVDTLASAVKLDTDKYGQSYETQQPLAAIARKLGPNVLLSHHSQKSAVEGYSVIDAALGSVGVAAVASTRMATRMYRLRGERFFTFEMSGSRWGTPLEGELIIRRNMNGLVEDGGMWRSKSIAVDKEAILKLLAGEPEGYSRNTLWREMRPKPKWPAFQDALDELIGEQRIRIERRTGKGGGQRIMLVEEPISQKNDIESALPLGVQKRWSWSA